MKIKWSTNLVVNVVIIGFVMIVIALLIPEFASVRSTTIADPIGSTVIDEVNSDNVKPIDANISDTVRYGEYKEMKDSIRRMRDLKNGVSPSSGGSTAGFIGTSSGRSCDTCSLWWLNTHFRDIHEQHYVVLPGWKLKLATTDWGANTDDSVKFFVEHGQAYVRKAINTYTKMKDGSTYHTMHIKDIPVKFRYDDKAQNLLIPVSIKTKNVVSIIAWCVLIFILVYFLYLVAAFLKFVLDLSKGHAFTDENVKRLLVIALSLLIAPVLILILNLIMRFIFRDYFMPDVISKTSSWKDSWQEPFVGIVFLLLYRAFRQGKKLKDEHDLTV